MVGLEGGGVKKAIALLPTTSPQPQPLPLSPGELPKGEFPRKGETGDSEASGVKVCGERALRGVIGREGGEGRERRTPSLLCTFCRLNRVKFLLDETKCECCHVDKKVFSFLSSSAHFVRLYFVFVA